MRLFTCIGIPKTAKLRLTPKACATYYKIMNGEFIPYRLQNLASFRVCKDCSKGKKNYLKYYDKVKKKKPKKKICKLYEVAPDLCKSSNIEGVFVKKNYHLPGSWFNKIYCCKWCGEMFNKMLREGRIK